KTRVNPPKDSRQSPSKTIFIADSLKAHRNSRKAMSTFVLNCLGFLAQFQVPAHPLCTMCQKSSSERLRAYLACLHDQWGMAPYQAWLRKQKTFAQLSARTRQAKETQ